MEQTTLKSLRKDYPKAFKILDELALDGGEQFFHTESEEETAQILKDIDYIKEQIDILFMKGNH